MNPVSKFYFKHRDGRVEGPFPKPVVLRLEERFPGGAMCSETADLSRPDSWLPLTESPALTEPDEPGLIRTWMPALALPAAALWAFLSLSSEPPRPARAPPAALSGYEQAADIFLPSCGRTLAELAGGGLQAEALNGGRWRLTWLDGRGRKSFEYDASDGSLRPLDAPSADLLNPRKGCPS